MEQDVVVVALAVLAFSLLAGRLSGSVVTMPMVFTALGLLLGPGMLGVLDLQVGDELVSVLAEVTLVVVLFTDASRMDLRTVLRHHGPALRLLGLGLPLAIAAGTVVGVLLLPDLPVAAVALLAVTLAPTDAALGQSFVSDVVPPRVRQTLNVESGLNDGLAVPFLTVALDLAARDAGSVGGYVVLLLQLVGLGVGVGALVGWLGGRLLEWSSGRDWATETTQRLATVALAALAYGGAELLGGNGFVAAFAAGLVVGTSARSLLPRTTEFAEAEGQLLTQVTFLLFGAVVVADVLGALDWRVVVYAVLSLVLVRPVAVVVALLGSGLRRRTVGFVAWAGPRGLASIVYAVVVADAGVPGGDEVFAVAATAILLSVVLHGTTAAPLSARYGASMQGVEGPAVEHRTAGHLPLRLPARQSGDSSA
ncbi:cation:proton antiporter domain-containing protein [Pseudokineococcus sp. 1T1Z-3]|uniref:cation:proton antiporter domain-containing protein n=1 Tax=Pseudokineococcus sp. 1T1Z-3 TaxID=3132745 RepID=UPI0030AC91B9